MPPNLEYFVVCRSVSFDVETDEITLSNVIEDVYLGSDGTAVLPRAVAISSWNIADGDRSKDFQTILTITLPGQSEGMDFPTNFDEGRHRYRAICTVAEIPLSQPGELKFEILLNRKHAASHKVLVHPPGMRSYSGQQLLGESPSRPA
ncbi:MAG TPA: hypothetical protein VGI99_11535 [Gemmataceae bacterium]|jgi:hypothetical protein